MQHATQKQFEKEFNMDDGEKAGGRPGRGKLKTQGMNKAGKRKAGFSGRGRRRSTERILNNGYELYECQEERT